MEHLLKVLDNGSVSAFLGAFFAYLLVLATDQRRTRTKVSTLSTQMRLNISHAGKKLETLRGLRDDLRTHRKVSIAEIQKFNVAQIRALTAEIVTELSIEHRECIEALCYTMDATDNLIARAQGLAEIIYASRVTSSTAMSVSELLSDYENSVSNLKKFQDMASLYVAGNYVELINKKYSVADYIE